MSNTNLAGKRRSIVTWTIFTTSEKEYSKDSRPGESLQNINNNRLNVVAGQQPMELSAHPTKINENGDRSDGSKRKNMDNFEGKRKRAKEFTPYQEQERQANNQEDKEL